MISDWSVVDWRSISGCSVIDQWSISDWSLVDQWLISDWLAIGQWSVGDCSVIKQWWSVIDQWSICGWLVINQWLISPDWQTEAQPLNCVHFCFHLLLFWRKTELWEQEVVLERGDGRTDRSGLPVRMNALSMILRLAAAEWADWLCNMASAVSCLGPCLL